MSKYMERIKIQDLTKYKDISGLSWAPGGAHAAFIVTESDLANNDYQSALWIYDNAVGARVLSEAGTVSEFVWEDAIHLLYPASRTEEDRFLGELGFTSFYKINVLSGEGSFAFRLPVRCGKPVAIGNGRYCVVADMDKRRPDFHLLTADERKTLLNAMHEEDDYEVIETLPWWYNGVGHTHHIMPALYLCDPAGGSVVRLTDDLMKVADVFSCCGNIYFTAFLYSPNGIMSEKMGLYAVSLLEEQASIRTVQRPGELVYEGVCAGENGVIIKGSTQSQAAGNFYCADVISGKNMLFANYDRCLTSTVGSDCHRGSGTVMKMWNNKVYFVATVGHSGNLCTIDCQGSAETLIGDAGSAWFFDINEAGEILVCGQYDMKLPELYLYERGKRTQVTFINEGLLDDKYVAAPEKLMFHSEGWDIEGWTLKPIGFTANGRYPAVLSIHGGPKTTFSECFFHEMQVWAGLGYFVLYCNPIGSDGRGDDFTFGVYGESRPFHRDYNNLMDFVDAMLDKYPQIDSKRIAVTGGSYGGYMTNWIIGHTDRFACAVTKRSIANKFTSSALSDWNCLGDAPEEDIRQGVSIYDEPAVVWDESPLKYARAFKTPTLIIHSDCDFRCSIAEGYQMFYALKTMHVDTRMVVFKGENHGLSRSGKPLHRIRRLTEITNWITNYTLEGKGT